MTLTILKTLRFRSLKRMLGMPRQQRLEIACALGIVEGLVLRIIRGVHSNGGAVSAELEIELIEGFHQAHFEMSQDVVEMIIVL